MKSKTDTPKPEKGSGSRAHRPRHNKPKFEIPVETAQPETATSWVTRSASEAAESAKHMVAEPIAMAENAARHAAKSAQKMAHEANVAYHHPDDVAAARNPTMVRLSVAMFAVGITIMGQMSLAAFDMMTMPFRWGRSLVTPKS